MSRFIILCALLFNLLAPCTGQDRAPLMPPKLVVPLVIDGKLDEGCWKDKPGLSGFKTFSPDYGKEMPFNTAVWLAYDEENLYFAFRCDDPEPQKIKVSVDARDKIRSDDWVCVNLDSFNDQQTLYCIYANANGIQMDTRFAAGTEDLGMDLVFYSAGNIDSAGYSVEIKLPLKSIRFSNREPVMMAATFERHISRILTNGTYPPLAADQAMAFLTQMQPIQYDGVKHYTLLEILPAVTYSYRAEHSDGKMTTTENKPDAGLTVKYGITSQMILDATLNPDFSQVEADAGQVDVNLRYQLFYPEKRPFFQEGNENFQTGAVSSGAFDPALSFVHTRNIADPLSGLKLSGKVGRKNTVSVLYSTDRIAEPEDTVYGNLAHFMVVRYKRSLKSDSYLGVLGTARLTEESVNYVAGADGNIRLNKSTMLEFHSMFSSTDDPVAGIESETGHAASAYIHSEKRNFIYSLSLKDISEDFTTRTGFIERTGFTMISGRIMPRFYPDSKFFKRIDIDLYSSQTRDNIYDKWETSNALTFDSRIDGSLRFYLRLSGSTEIYLDRKYNTSAFQPTLTGYLGTRLSAAIAYKLRYGIYYPAREQGIGESFVGDIRFLPWEKLHTQLTVTYQDLYRESDRAKLYDYLIVRGLINLQLNKYLFLRTITEFNSYRESLKTDFLVSFTYIPGTVFHIGYGNLFEKLKWDGSSYIPDDRMHEIKRGFFTKFSYLFRL